MTEREKNEIRKGYADLIIKNLTRNKILIPTETEEKSETDQTT